MKKFLRNALRFLASVGMEPRKGWIALRGLPAFLCDLREFNRQQIVAETRFPRGQMLPCLSDRFEENGSLDRQYFHQDLWAAQKIFAHNPTLHVDVGSRVDGFVAHVASFRKVQVLDIRQTVLAIPNIEFIRADLMADLPRELIEYCDSLSCLHALEHFGLGRYGDPVNVNGHIFGLRNLPQMLKPQGRLYLSVPIGPQRVEFNAHRVFSVRYLLGLFAEQFSLASFSIVDDDGNFHSDVMMDDAGLDSNFGCTYGCGMFELIRK